MDLFQVVLFICIIVGIFLIVFSLFITSADSKGEPDNNFREIDAVAALNASIEEIDRTMEELNGMSKAIFEEIDEKYQELLFLYTLIDEKKNELADIYKNSATPKKDGNKRKDRQEKEKDKGMGPLAGKAFENPHLQDILQLRSQGEAISEIAKRLNIGQGEVKLILELGKPR